MKETQRIFKPFLYLILIILLSIPTLTMAEDWELTIDNWGFEREVKMRPRFDYDPTHEYRGIWENDGAMKLKPRFDYDPSKRLRGYVDPDGYGTLRDYDGNIYKIRPKYP